MKLEKKDKIYIFFIVLFASLFVGLFFLTISGWFYGDNNISNTDLIFGGTSVIEIESASSSVLSFNFDGAILGGEKVNYNLSIKNKGEKDVFLRAKVVCFSANNSKTNIYLETNSHWDLKDDGYYYCLEPCASLGTVALASGLIFSKEELASQEDYILTIVVESLTTDVNKTIIWGY